MNNLFVETSHRGKTGISRTQLWASAGIGTSILALVLRLIGIDDVPGDVLDHGYAFFAFLIAFFLRRAV